MLTAPSTMAHQPDADAHLPLPPSTSGGTRNFYSTLMLNLKLHLRS
jgi:hypothetical protein